jgi:RNA polymerase sigma factor (sigma-70 family)
VFVTVDALLRYPISRETTEPMAVDDAAADATASFVPFYRETRDRMARALALTLGDGSLAAEAVDEAMARAYQRWDQVSRYDAPAGWVYRVALNCASSTLRRHRRQPRPHHTPDTAELGHISEPDVAVALSELGLRQRSVVVCRFYLGMSEAETAAALGIRPGTVKSRLHRALNHLHIRLSHLNPEEQA